MEIRAFDRTKLLKNISAVIQERGVKIGELETSVGVSPGYLSRLSKDDIKTLPPLDVVWRIAKALSVNMERLIEGNFDHASETVTYMQQFLQKLFEDTVNSVIDWNSKSVNDVNCILREEDNECFAFIHTDYGADYKDDRSFRDEAHYDRGTYECYKQRKITPVTSPKTNAWVDDSVFSTIMPSGQTLYLVRYGTPTLSDEDDLEVLIFYELYFDNPESQNDAVVPICNTFGNKKVLLPDIEKLYQELKEHEFDLRISKEARFSIDLFMGKAVPQSNRVVEVDDDELPF